MNLSFGMKSSILLILRMNNMVVKLHAKIFTDICRAKKVCFGLPNFIYCTKSLLEIKCPPIPFPFLELILFNYFIQLLWLTGSEKGLDRDKDLKYNKDLNDLKLYINDILLYSASNEMKLCVIIIFPYKIGSKNITI